MALFVAILLVCFFGYQLVQLVLAADGPVRRHPLGMFFFGHQLAQQRLQQAHH